MFKAVLLILKSPRSFYNLDPFKASTGKVLTKTEKNLDMALNVLCAYPTALVLLATRLLAIVLTIIFVVVVFKVTWAFAQEYPIIAIIGLVTLTLGNAIDRYIKKKKDSIVGNTSE